MDACVTTHGAKKIEWEFPSSIPCFPLPFLHLFVTAASFVSQDQHHVTNNLYIYSFVYIYILVHHLESYLACGCVLRRLVSPSLTVVETGYWFFGAFSGFKSGLSPLTCLAPDLR
jgi:hypothetical protein